MQLNFKIISYIASGLGLTILTIPLIPALTTRVSFFLEEQAEQAESNLVVSRLQIAEESKRQQFQEKQKTLQAREKLAVQIEYSERTIENYTDNPNKPPKLDTSIFKSNEEVILYDKNGACVGRIRNQKFEWKRWYKNTCISRRVENVEK